MPGSQLDIMLKGMSRHDRRLLLAAVQTKNTKRRAKMDREMRRRLAER